MTEPLREGVVSRRDFVAGISALGTVWLTAAACARDEQKAAAPAMLHPAATEAPVPPPQLRHFSKDQAAEIEAVTARIIPTDDTPGAREAGVVYFVDNTLTTFAKDQVPLFDQGLRDLAKAVTTKHGAAAKFSTLTPAQQDAILHGLEKTPFFGALRFATIAGFLALPKYGGNKDYMGWAFVGQEHAFEQKPPFGWYDRPENQQALLGRVL